MSLIILSCPRGSRQGERDITRRDYRVLRQNLLYDPKSVLDLFNTCNLAYLSDLGDWWDALREAEPERTDEIIEMAAQMGISAKPMKPAKGVRACRR